MSVFTQPFDAYFLILGWSCVVFVSLILYDVRLIIIISYWLYDYISYYEAVFKSVSPLFQAGVQHTQAAREVVQMLNPRPQLAIHGLL